MIRLPIKLANEANSSEHYTKSGKRHRMQKFLITSAMKKHATYGKKEYLQSPPYAVFLTRGAPIQIDSDNLQSAFKWIRDAIAEELLNCKTAGRADGTDDIGWFYWQEKTKTADEFIEIRIYQPNNLGPLQNEYKQALVAALSPISAMLGPLQKAFFELRDEILSTQQLQP